MRINPTRRSLLKALGFGTLGAGGAVAGYLYGTRIEPERLRLERVSIPIEGLGSGLDGLRIALLTDFHLYPHTRIDLIRSAVEMSNRLKPDLVLLGGDYVQSRADAILDLAPVLAMLDARYGIFGILGNHDHWKGADVVEEQLTKAGLPVLRNRGVTLAINQSPLYLAGLDDGWVRRHDLARALEGRPAETDTLLLMHEPDFADDHCRDGRIALQLSGHSHGGQVRLPLIGSPFLPPHGRKYDMGLYRVRDMWLYTSVGIGLTAPIRLNCPPEVTEITLVRA